MMRAVTFIGSCLLWANCLRAQEINTDRPNETESARSVPTGMFQIESGLLSEFTGVDTTASTLYFLPTTLFRVGIVKGLEIRMVSQVESRNYTRNESKLSKLGLSNLQLGAKLVLLQRDDANTEIAFLSHVVFPSGSFDADRKSYGSINRLLVSHKLGDKADVGYNFGYNYFGDGPGEFSYSMAFGFQLGRFLALFVEPYGELLELKFHEASIDAGFVFLVRDNIQLDWSFGTGLNYKMNFLSAGFSILLDGNLRSVDKNMR